MKNLSRYALALAALLALGGLASSSTMHTLHREQHGVVLGSNGQWNDCSDYNAFWLANIHLSTAPHVDVKPGSVYTVSAEWKEMSEPPTPFVDFFDANGNWGGYSGGALQGKVPMNAAFGIVCVGVADTYPTVPAVGATWSYEDGA